MLQRLVEKYNSEQTFRRRAALALAAVAALMIALNLSLGSRSLVKGELPAGAAADESSAPERDEPSSVTDQSSYRSDGSRRNTLSELESELEDTLSGLPGQWSLYLKRLDNGDTIYLDPHPVYPASMVKLFALGAAYQKIEDGVFPESMIREDLEEMAVHSSNEAYNDILWTIGTGYIREWCQDNGYTDTYVYHGLRPADNADGLDTMAYNETTAQDVGKILEDIYNGECVSKAWSARMLSFLLDQEYREKIPAGLPQGVTCANKTGETEDVSHDSAIVYTDKCDYILVITSEIPEDAYDYFGEFTAISARVYEYITNGE